MGLQSRRVWAYRVIEDARSFRSWCAKWGFGVAVGACQLPFGGHLSSNNSSRLFLRCEGAASAASGAVSHALGFLGPSGIPGGRCKFSVSFCPFHVDSLSV